MKGTLDEPLLVFDEDFEAFRANHQREPLQKFATP